MVRPFYWPPSMVAKQTRSFFSYARLTGWKRSTRWLFSRGIGTLPVAAGAVGMGCIGFPNHPVWEITAACNERCIHCHASGGRPGPDELTTEEGMRLIDGIAECDEFRMLVYTGGEPMVRKDLFDLLAYSKKVGFRNVIATNGIDIDLAMARELKKLGVFGLAISLDHTVPEIHNRIRARRDAFDRALRAMDACTGAGLVLQVNVTAMEYNLDDLENVIRLADEKRAAIVLNYQLVEVGRGRNIAGKSVQTEKNRSLMDNLIRWQRDVTPIIEPVASPQYWPNLLVQNGLTSERDAERFAPIFHGCTAGIGLAYIKPNGDVWSCPFVEVSGGNVRERPFSAIWRESPLFVKLRDRSALKGDCGGCKFNILCGGCRGKAWAATGDLFDEDPTCFIDREVKLRSPGAPAERREA